jgi:multiple antibiotic resistance protein
MHDFLLAFIPLFVAVDAVGTLPVLLGLLEQVEKERHRRVIVQSVITAATVAVVFVFAGRPLLRMLGITPSDFMIAGGALLFVLSLRDLLAAGKATLAIDQDTVGAVPIGMPLITGPAVLTTCMLLVEQPGMMIPTLLAVLANVVLAGVVYWFADPICARLGSSGSKVLSKIANLLLAAIAVMMVRKGIVALLASPVGT